MFLHVLVCIGLLSPRRFVEVKVCELVTLGSLDPILCSWDLLWSRPFVASWDLLWSLGSSQSFCGLCLKIVVRDSISAQKEINSGR